jgi:hypothetical protein
VISELAPWEVPEERFSRGLDMVRYPEKAAAYEFSHFPLFQYCYCASSDKGGATFHKYASYQSYT